MSDERVRERVRESVGERAWDRQSVGERECGR